jgi:hypothetical protein
VLAHRSRYTHRVAIAKSRLISFEEQGVTFKDYRIDGRDRNKRMTLATDEFIRHFLIYVLPKSSHRIRHYGLFAKRSCAANVARAQKLFDVAKTHQADLYMAKHATLPASETFHKNGHEEPNGNSLTPGLVEIPTKEIGLGRILLTQRPQIGGPDPLSVTFALCGEREDVLGNLRRRLLSLSSEPLIR